MKRKIFVLLLLLLLLLAILLSSVPSFAGENRFETTGEALPGLMKDAIRLINQHAFDLKDTEVVLVEKLDPWLKATDREQLGGLLRDKMAFHLGPLAGGPSQAPYFPIYIRKDTAHWNEVIQQSFENRNVAVGVLTAQLLHEILHAVRNNQTEAECLQGELNMLRLLQTEGLFNGPAAEAYIAKVMKILAKEQ